MSVAWYWYINSYIEYWWYNSMHQYEAPRLMDYGHVFAYFRNVSTRWSEKLTLRLKRLKTRFFADVGYGITILFDVCFRFDMRLQECPSPYSKSLMSQHLRYTCGVCVKCTYRIPHMAYSLVVPRSRIEWWWLEKNDEQPYDFDVFPRSWVIYVGWYDIYIRGSLKYTANCDLVSYVV